jgi:hypothetical protein
MVASLSKCNRKTAPQKDEATMQPLPKSKTRVVKLSQILRTPDGKIDHSANVREDIAYTLADLQPLIDSIAETRTELGGSGIKDRPVMMETKDDKDVLQIIQGHRRLHAYEIVVGGNMDATFEAVVYPYLERAQFISLLMDHGQRKNLNQVETYYAICRAYEYGLNQKSIAIEVRPLLEAISPLTDKQKADIGDTSTDVGRQKLLDRYRGIVQNHIRAFELPPVVGDAWVKKQRKEQSWPATNELIELHQTFMGEKNASNNLYNRTNPGPKFLERWKKIVDAREAAEANGTRSKSTGMKNRKDLEELAKRSDLFAVRLVTRYILNEITDEQYRTGIKVQAELEAGMTEEQKQLLLKTFMTDEKKPEEQKPPETAAA